MEQIKLIYIFENVLNASFEIACMYVWKFLTTETTLQALYLLLQCGYNIEEALRRKRMNAVPPADTMSLWSEEECRAFETGLRVYGKDFHSIQAGVANMPKFRLQNAKGSD
jgi:hypothetical protein